MLSLERQQLALLAMLTNQPADVRSDPWLEIVAQSDGLKTIHNIATWWQRFQLEGHCRYTSRLMKRLGCFESYVHDYFRINPTPPSIEELRSQFLSSLVSNDDSLLSAVARFELSCLELKDDCCKSQTIIWDRDPTAVLGALENSDALPGPETNARFVMHLSTELPGSVSCVREELTPH